MLTDEDRRNIAAAVSRAEAESSAEISCVLAEEASHYREVPLAWAAIAALLLPPVALAFGFEPLALADMISGWAAAQSSTVDTDILLALSAYAVVQAVLFAAVAFVVSVPGVRRRLTPGFVKSHRVMQSARHHFLAQSARLGDGRPFVLIYASRRDRRVEILASPAAHKAVGESVWREAASVLGASMRERRAGEGFARAVEICGTQLARHFPPGEDRRNMLPDTLIET